MIFSVLFNDFSSPICLILLNSPGRHHHHHHHHQYHSFNCCLLWIYSHHVLMPSLVLLWFEFLSHLFFLSSVVVVIKPHHLHTNSSYKFTVRNLNYIFKVAMKFLVEAKTNETFFFSFLWYIFTVWKSKQLILNEPTLFYNLFMFFFLSLSLSCTEVMCWNTIKIYVMHCKSMSAIAEKCDQKTC